jgi:SAM-dependent methyltransferase
LKAKTIAECFNSRPRNVQFYVDDLEAPWLNENVFDFIFARDSTLCFEKPYFVLESAFKALKPGGHIEFQNIILPFRCDGDALRGTAFREWMDLISKGAENLSRNWHTASECRASMEQVGLVDIHVKEYTWPIGTWPKSDCDKLLGTYVYWTLVELKGLYAISAKVLRKGMKMDIGKINDLIRQVEQELSCNISKVAIPV